MLNFLLKCDGYDLYGIFMVIVLFVVVIAAIVFDEQLKETITNHSKPLLKIKKHLGETHIQNNIERKEKI